MGPGKLSIYSSVTDHRLRGEYDTVVFTAHSRNLNSRDHEDASSIPLPVAAQ